ncbi:MAG: transglycosylase SLT domain-containing protein [Pseudomonadota bacterium]|nr:transglycosylase SLT domain-containing protein [Pseudomonadota bacterium]
MTHLFSSPRQRALAAALAACAWLAGCAAPGTTSPDGQPTTDAATETAPSARGTVPPVAVTELNGSRVATLNTPADLWERIRRGFALPDLDTDLVRQREQWYASQPDYIQRMTERSRMYIFHIVEELELRGMPTELALLPYIESAFNPQAVSSAKAAGMWQFMPATGSSFELRQNALRDDRRDVIASTRAALDYLQKLHDRFGDWHLALAAYNWGQGNVNRAIERNKAAGLGTGYLDLNMPAETRHYVPKLQAVKNIIANPAQFDAVLPDIGNHPFFDTVDITHDIDLELAAQLAEVRTEDFRALNPSMNRPVIFAAAAPQVLLPWDNAATFKRNLQQRITAGQPLASYTAWVAPATMTVAEASQRTGMDAEQLRALNRIPPRMQVRAGSTLLVPRGNGAAAKVASHVVDNATVSFTPEIVLRRTTVRARKGDTIARIASRYDLPAATVAGWNNANARASLKRNQAVVLYLPVRAGQGQARSSQVRSSAKAPARTAAAPVGKRGRAQTSAPASTRATPSKGQASKGSAKVSAKTSARPSAKPAAPSAKKNPAAKAKQPQAKRR